MKYRLKGASGAATGQTFEIGEGLRIGSSPEADLRGDDLRPDHARIRVVEGGLVLDADGPAEVNGEAVQRRALESGDELRFGTQRFVLQAPGLKPVRVLDDAPPPSSGWLAWAAGAAIVAAAAAAAWWWLGPGSGAAG